MRRFVLVVLMLGCLAAMQARAQAPAPSAEARAVAALPAVLGPFRRAGEVRDFEALPNGRGLGAAARYVAASGEQMHATVALYGRSSADGAEGPEVRQELRAFDETMNAMVRAGRYRSAAFASAMQIDPTAALPGVRCASYGVVQSNGTRTADSICLTAQHGRLVKVRLTVPEEQGPQAAGLLAAGLTTQVLEALAARRPS